MSQINTSEISDVFLQTLENMYETALDATHGNPALYGFYKDNIFIDDSNPVGNEDCRYYIRYNIDSETRRSNKITKVLVSFQIFDLKSKTNKSDKTFLLYEILKLIADPELAYFARTAEMMHNGGQISQKYIISKAVIDFKMSHFQDQFGAACITKFYEFQIQATT